MDGHWWAGQGAGRMGSDFSNGNEQTYVNATTAGVPQMSVLRVHVAGFSQARSRRVGAW